jgi:hypothetical protein
MSRRKQLDAGLEGGVAGTSRPSLPAQPRLGAFQMREVSGASSDLAETEVMRAQAMLTFADILLSIFLELSLEEQVKYLAGASGGEPSVV